MENLHLLCGETEWKIFPHQVSWKKISMFNFGTYWPDKGRVPPQKGLFAYLIKQYELKENKAKLIEESQSTLKRVMNPASHASTIPFFGAELKDAIAAVKKLKIYLSD